MLHFLAESLSIPLSHIFNLSLNTKIFPERFKISKTNPIYKSGDLMDHTNYRGISLINIFSEVFEKILFIKFYTWIDDLKLFNENQSNQG